MHSAGLEARMTVGAGHFTATVRAFKGNCEIPFASIANHDGRLSEELGRRDKCLGRCMIEGWKWRAFSWQCEVAWP